MTGHTRRSPVVVVGDCLLDIDLTGAVSRLCADGPAPVVESLEESVRPGGAGLAALIAARQRPVVLITALGADEAGERLRHLLDQHLDVIDLGSDRTVVKTRVRVAGRTLLRMDQEENGAIPLRHVPDELGEVMREAAGVLVSDYGLGLTGHTSIRRHVAVAPTVWDPHPRGSRPVPGVTTVTPNAREAQHFSGLGGDDLPSAIKQGVGLARRWNARSVTVTRGAEGAVVCGDDLPPLVVPAPHQESGDTCGAGDACAAGIVSALAEGHEVPDAVRSGVQSAADYLRDGGVAGLFAPRAGGGTSGEARDVVDRVRAAGGTVVMAGGCFDLLHAGHVSYLEAARRLGDCLVVAINSDDSVRRLKGPERPLVPEQDRARVLRALSCVDAVEIFASDTPSGVLQTLQPDIFAKGGDYQAGSLPEAAVVKRYGGQVVTLPLLEGRSSTRLVEAARTRAPLNTEEEECRTQPA